MLTTILLATCDPAGGSGTSAAWPLVPFFGCSQGTCSGHGQCVREGHLNRCDCDLGWTGRDCSVDSCPAGLRQTAGDGERLPATRHCSGRGLCLAG